jgi:hypothetical protein
MGSDDILHATVAIFLLYDFGTQLGLAFDEPQ